MADSSQQLPLQEEPIQTLDPVAKKEVTLSSTTDINPYNPDMTDIIGTLAAYAQIDSSDPNMTLDKFADKVELNKSAIELGEEVALREEIMLQEQLLETSRIREFVISTSVQQNANLEEIELLLQTLPHIQGDEITNNLEKTALDRIQEFALLHPEQGDMIEVFARDIEAGGSLLGTLRNRLEAVIEIKRETDKARKKMADQSIPADIVDILATLIPGNRLTSIRNDIIKTSMLDLTGTAKLVIRQRLQDMSASERAVKLPIFVQALVDESAWIGENIHLIYANLHALGEGGITEKSKNLENLFDYVDALVMAPSLKLIPKLTKAGIAKYALNRDLSKRITEHTMTKAEDDVIEQAFKGETQLAAKETEEAISQVQVSAFTDTASLLSGEVKSSGAITSLLEAGRVAMENVRSLLSEIPRLTEVEMKEAFTAAKAEYMKRFGKGSVIDFKWINREIVPGVKIPQVSAILGRLDGVGYSSRAAAFKAAENKGILLADESHASSKATWMKLQAAKKKERKVRDTVQGNIEKIEQKGKRGDSKVDAAINKELDKIDRAKAASSKADNIFENALNKQVAARTKNDEIIRTNKQIGITLKDGADQQFFINVKFNINEGAYVHKLFEEGKTTSSIINKFVMGGTLRSPSSFLPEILQGKAVKSVFTNAKIEAALQPLLTNLRGLSRSERKRVGAVAKQGNIDKEWYTSSKFTNMFTKMHNERQPSAREVLAYYTLKDVNDLEWMLQNHSLFTERAVQGFVTGQVVAPNGIKVSARNMKEIEHIEDVNRALMLDVSKNTVIEGRKVGTEALKDRMKLEGLKLMRIEKTIEHNGKKVNHILVKKGDLSTKDLEYRQLPYVAGGHRLYKGSYFAKQAVIGMIGKYAFVENPITHIVGPTKGTVSEWVERMEGARKAYATQLKDGSYTAQADRIIMDANIEGGVVEWAKLLDDGVINNNPFQVTFRGEAPKLHTETLSEKGTYDLTFEEFGRSAYLDQPVLSFMKHKGNILKGPQDETAELINPFTAATRSVEAAARTAAYTNYKLNAIQRWMKTYGDLIPGDGLSPLQKFWSDFNLTSLKTQNVFKMNEAQIIRKAIQRQLGTSTMAGEGVKNALRGLATLAEGGATSGVRTAVAKGALNLMDKDPISALKGFSFDLKLGLFDPSQLIIQTQTIAALFALNPTRAHRYMMDAPLMRYAVVNQSDEMLAYVAKRSGMEAKDFTAMVKSMRQSGITDINGELIMLDHNASSAIVGVGSVVQDIRRMGRIPFFEAERWNRIYAWRKSWDDLRSGTNNPNAFRGGKPQSIKQMMTPDVQVEMARLTDKFTMNMTSASAAFWQKGILSIPTQFLSYQARLFENVLPVILGGNRQWSRGEKARLFIGQIFLYGATGFPGARYVLQNFLEHTGVEFDPDSLADQTAYRAMVGGFWDSMLYAVTIGELDVAFSQRAAVGKAMEDVWEKIMGGGFETQSILQVLGGAPFSVIGDVSSDAYDLIHTIYTAAASETVSVTDLDPMLITRLTDNASSLSRLHRWYWINTMGEWRSQETGKTLTKATSMEQIAGAMGFQLRDLADAQFTVGIEKARTEFIREQAKLINKLQIEAARLWQSGDKEGWTQKQREITMWQQALNSRDRDAVSKAARKRFEWRTWTEIQRQHWEDVYLNGIKAGRQPAPNITDN